VNKIQATRATSAPKRALEDLVNFFMPIGHCGNDRVLILEIAINQADTDPGPALMSCILAW
jgi:hypothetical protein